MTAARRFAIPRTATLTPDQAREIARAWPTETVCDEGMAVYVVARLGGISDENHRTNLLAYIDSCLPAAEDADKRGEPAIVLESNVADLEALRAWAVWFALDEGGAS